MGWISTNSIPQVIEDVFAINYRVVSAGMFLLLQDTAREKRRCVVSKGADQQRSARISRGGLDAASLDHEDGNAGPLW
jgi:hypothetical protein